MIYSISKDKHSIAAVQASTFKNLDIWERRDIQEWVRKCPQILGENLLILSIEFDRFSNSNDRLDILALDTEGNLVVIELKRDSAAGLADLQAIRYAAMVSSMTIDMVIPYFIAYSEKYCGEQIKSLEAKERIEKFVELDEFYELSSKPRIILCSEGFSTEITTTVLWLRQSGIDITCVKITPYSFDGQSVIVPTVIIPLQEAKQYLIEIQKKDEEQVQGTRKIAQRTMKFLVESGLLKADDKIYLNYGLPEYISFIENDPYFSATITGKIGQSDAIRWDYDGQEYAISALTWKIFTENHPEKTRPAGAVNGNWHWVDKNGQQLWHLAKDNM